MIQFKLFLIIGGQQQEVRRLSYEGIINIGRLNTVIRDTFTRLEEREFGLKWIDEEGDKVDITTQEDLVLAMQEMRKHGSVFKLHVYLYENAWWKEVSSYLITWQHIKVEGVRAVHRGPQCIIYCN